MAKLAKPVVKRRCLYCERWTGDEYGWTWAVGPRGLAHATAPNGHTACGLWIDGSRGWSPV